MANVYVKSGDVTRDVQVDAIVTLINSDGWWLGGVDGAIKRVAGGLFHAQAARAELSDGKVVVAKQGYYSHSGSFKDVIFVVDDLRSILSELVYSALVEAKNQGYQSVSLPLMRTGVMLGAVEPDVRAVVEQMKFAIRKFFEDYKYDLTIYIVVYNNPQAEKILLEDGSMTKL